VVGHTETVRNVLQTLNHHQIYSAPVYNEDTKEFEGMIDMLDIVEFISQNFDEAQLLGEGFEAIFEQAERFGSTPIHDVVDHSHRGAMVKVTGDADMHSVVKLLSDTRIHRVNVFDAELNLVNIITQSSVLNHLQKHREAIKGLAHKTIGELEMGTSPVISVDINSQTIDAFKTLRKHHLYAVPVVNKQLGGAIVANISAKDVRAACKDPSRLYLLYSPISQFLNVVHQAELNIGAPSITCAETDTISTLIQKLVLNQIHRVYTLNERNAPARVVSLTDLLHVLVDE